MSVLEKKCTKCGVIKPAECFYAKKANLDGKRPDCIDCVKAWRALNKNKIAEEHRRWYQNNKPQERNKQTLYRKVAHDRISVGKKDYYKRNADKVKKRQNAYEKARRSKDPLYRLKGLLRGVVRRSFDAKGFVKTSRTAQILGCTWEELKAHIEGQFWPGMTWENAGEWHLDHRVPVSTATTEVELLQLNHYTNLQPLWADDNLKKNDRLDWTPTESKHPLPQVPSDQLDSRPRLCYSLCMNTTEIYNYVKSLAPDAEMAPDGVGLIVRSHKFVFEVAGLFSHSSADPKFRKNVSRDRARFCHEQGLKYLMVFEDELESNPELIKAMVRFRVNQFQGQYLAARDLELKRLEGRDFKDFFEKFHIDGSTNSSFGYGLVHDGKFVMAATCRRSFTKEHEIARLATDYNYCVRGGGGRVIKAIIDEVSPAALTTYSNNRLSTGDIYKQLGFTDITVTNTPSYYYCNGKTRVWRYRCKRINDPQILAKYPEVPHTEVGQALGGVFSEVLFGVREPFYRIEDCGHTKWKFNKRQS